jgi:ubiquinone/menaquinone biosynthesis C-methylase UbiE
MDKTLYDRAYYKSSKDFQLMPERTEMFVNEILKYHPKSVLDVGCGLGALVHELNKIGIPSVGVDFAPDLKEHYWGKAKYFELADARSLPFEHDSFDVVFSSDFFEHIDEKYINQVANEMKRVGNKVITYVADSLGKPLNQHQRLYHVTHQPIEWWVDKLPGIEVHSAHDPIK